MGISSRLAWASRVFIGNPMTLPVSSVRTAAGLYNGIAPDADLLSVQAFDETGQGTYADVIRAIDWAILSGSVRSSVMSIMV